jgi:hypothetical protein
MVRSKGWGVIGIAGILGTGILCTVAGCNRMATKPTVAPTTAGSTPDSVSVTVSPSAAPLAKPLASQDFFPDPMVAGSAVQPTSIPNLIPPTTTVERVPQISAGRSDPFASLGLMPTVTVKPKPAASVVAAPAAPPITAIPVAAAPVAAPPSTVFPLPPLIPASPNLPSLPVGSLPSVSVPNTLIPPRSLAETIEISGVVEVAGKTNVIIQVPNEQTSRYAAVGERLDNGKVLIKRVEMGLEPVVILEQGGREIARSVGSGALIGAL